MRFIANIVSFITMIFGFAISALAKWTYMIDDSITTIAGLIGLVGALIWLRIAISKRKESKISLENAQLDNEIKKKQLENLNNYEI